MNNTGTIPKSCGVATRLPMTEDLRIGYEIRSLITFVDSGARIGMQKKFDRCRPIRIVNIRLRQKLLEEPHNQSVNHNRVSHLVGVTEQRLMMGYAVPALIDEANLCIQIRPIRSRWPCMMQVWYPQNSLMSLVSQMRPEPKRKVRNRSARLDGFHIGRRCTSDARSIQRVSIEHFPGPIASRYGDVDR